MTCVAGVKICDHLSAAKKNAATWEEDKKRKEEHAERERKRTVAKKIEEAGQLQRVRQELLRTQKNQALKEAHVERMRNKVCVCVHVR